MGVVGVSGLCRFVCLVFGGGMLLDDRMADVAGTASSEANVPDNSSIGFVSALLASMVGTIEDGVG